MDKKSKNHMPVECVYGLLCRLSSVDQERNNISLFDLIEQLNLDGKFFSTNDEKPRPIPLPHEIITLWRKTIDTSIDDRELPVDVEVVLLDPRGVPLNQIFATIKFNKNSRRTRFRLVTGTLTVTTPGDYVYRISIVASDGSEPQEVIRIPLEIKARI